MDKKHRKPNGYWNNYEHCYEEAQKYKTRGEFSKGCVGAYYWSRLNGWIDSFDWLVNNQIFGNNQVDCVYAYEFNDQNAVYVGRTLMRRVNKRDYEHRHREYIDKNGHTHTNYDGVYNFSCDNKCEIPPIKILKNDLTLEEGRFFENEYVESYRKNGWAIINKGKTGKNSGSIGSLNKGKWNEEKCKIIALDCKSLSEFKRKNGSAYEASRINGWLKKFDWFEDTSQLIKKALLQKDKKWTEEECYNLAKTCKTKSEFQNKSSRAYAVSHINGWMEKYTWFVDGFSLIEPIKWTEEECKKIAVKCKTKSDFRNKNASAYYSALHHGWINNYDWFIDGNIIAADKRRIYTEEKCFEIAQNCKTKAEFKKENNTAYNVSRINGWIKNYTWFKSGIGKDRKWSESNIKLEATKYVHKREFMLGSNVAYRKAKKNNILKTMFKIMKFNFKGYFDVPCFDLEINADISINSYKYIQFTHEESQKIVFNYYKEEMQQGNGIKVKNLGYEFIRLTGFYDIFPKKPSWEKFKKEFCPIILYTFEIKDDIILLTPINVNENNKIFQNDKNLILNL